MKKFFYDRRIISLYLFTIILLIIGVTYAINSNSLDLGLTTAVVRIDEQAYGQTEFDSSNLDFVPILDNEVEERKENVIDIDFRVGGASTNNNDHIIYDIVLKDLEVNCVLLSPYLKWKLVKNGEELATGSLDYHFDTIDEYGRLILTTIQEDLPRYSANQEGYDHYQFYLWLSDSCQSDDISACQNAPDQSEFMGQNLAGKIEVELYTEGKKEHVRKPSTTIGDSFCKDRYLVNFDPSGGSVSVPSKYVINGELFGELPIPTKKVAVSFETNGGSNVTLVNQKEEFPTIMPQNNMFSIPKVKLLENEVNYITIAYTFEGWYLDKEFTKKVNSTDEFKVTENITLYAKWSGDNTITLPNTSKAGYEFLGWYQDSQLKYKIGNPGDSYEVNDNQTIYGKWESKIYTVNFDSGNLLYGLEDTGTITDTNMTYSIHNEVVTVTANSNDGYGFTTGRVYLEAGRIYTFNCTTEGIWGNSASSDTVEAYFMLDGKYTTYYRMDSRENFQFTPSTSGTYWLRLDVNQSGKTYTFSDIHVSTSIGEKEVATGNEIGKLPTHSNDAYTLDEWYTDQNGMGTKISSTTRMPVGNTTYFANWEPQKFTVSYVSSLVSNGDFSNGTTGWTMSSFTSRETIAGKNAIRVTSTGTGTEGFRSAYIPTFKTNTKYRYSYKVYRDSTSSYGDLTKNFRVYMPEVNSSGSITDWHHYIDITNSNLPDKTWKEFSSEFTTSSTGANFHYMMLDYYGTAGQSTIWITDIKLEEIVNTSTVTYSQPYGNLPTPTRTGYNFAGWYDSESGGQSVTSNKLVDKAYNHSIYARWANAVYTVTYNGNGATGGSTANSTHTYGIAKNLTANGFARAYTVSYNANGGSVSPTSSTATYSFAGWSYNGTNYSNGQSVSNLTAINGGTVTMTARWNSASVTLPTPTRAGYSFNGWYTAASGGTLVGNAGASYTPTSTLTVYAHWVDNIAPSAVTVSYNGGSNTCTWKNNYNISLSATDAGSGIKHYEIDWDGDGVANGTTVSNFIPGNGYSSCNNRFRAVDVAGNVGPWSAVHHIHMDTEAPAKTTVNLNGYTSGASATSTVTITPSASDNVGIAKFQYSHDGANWTDWPPGTGSWAITWNGNWYFYIRAVDHAGNVGTSCDVFHVIVNKPYQVSNGNYASTLAEAISLAAAGNTITLLANVTDSSAATFSKNLTFNSNGHTLTRTAAITINSGVSATFTGTGIIASSSTVINNKGTLKISNGNYVSTGSVNTITTSGTLTINAGNIMEYGGTDTSKSAISIAATAGTTTLNQGKIYSKKGRGVTIDKGAGMLYVGATGGTYEANGRDLIIYGGYVSIYGKNGKSTITLRNGTQYATGSEWVTANIDEKVSRGSCSFNTYANGSAKNYSNPALTIGSYTIAAGNKNCYKLWLSKSTTSTATCPS